MARALAWRWISTAVLALALSACGTGERESASASAVETCTTIADASACLQPAPSYAKDVAPLLEKECNRTCHTPGAGPWPLTTYADVAGWSAAIEEDVRGCTMPPPDAGVLSTGDRAMLLDWLACGSPRN